MNKPVGLSDKTLAGALTAGQSASVNDPAVASRLEERHQAMESITDIFETLDPSVQQSLLSDYREGYQHIVKQFGECLPGNDVDCELICDSDQDCSKPGTKEYDHAMGFIKLWTDLVAKMESCPLTTEEIQSMSGNNASSCK